MFYQKEIDSLGYNVDSLYSYISELEKQTTNNIKRIYTLEEKMSALQDLLDLSFTPRVVEVTDKSVGGYKLDSVVSIEPAKFTFVNRFPEKVKKNKEKKVITKKKK